MSAQLAPAASQRRQRRSIAGVSTHVASTPRTTLPTAGGPSTIDGAALAQGPRLSARRA
jgi:hypothetical protein